MREWVHLHLDPPPKMRPPVTNRLPRTAFTAITVAFLSLGTHAAAQQYTAQLMHFRYFSRPFCLFPQPLLNRALGGRGLTPPAYQVETLNVTLCTRSPLTAHSVTGTVCEAA